MGMSLPRSRCYPLADPFDPISAMLYVLQCPTPRRCHEQQQHHPSVEDQDQPEDPQGSHRPSVPYTHPITVRFKARTVVSPLALREQALSTSLLMIYSPRCSSSSVGSRRRPDPKEVDDLLVTTCPGTITGNRADTG